MTLADFGNLASVGSLLLLAYQLFGDRLKHPRLTSLRRPLAVPGWIMVFSPWIYRVFYQWFGVDFVIVARGTSSLTTAFNFMITPDGNAVITFLGLVWLTILVRLPQRDKSGSMPARAGQETPLPSVQVGDSAISSKRPNLSYHGSRYLSVVRHNIPWDGIRETVNDHERSIGAKALVLKFENDVKNDVGYRANDVIAKIEFMSDRVCTQRVEYGYWLGSKDRSKCLEIGDAGELILLFINRAGSALVVQDNRERWDTFNVGQEYYRADNWTSSTDVEVVLIERQTTSRFPFRFKIIQGENGELGVI